MAKFKCKQSGNVFNFEHLHDIEAMRKHPEYEEVVEQVAEEETPTKRPVGRPSKYKE